MIRRLFERLLLRPADLKPSRDDFEVIGAFNPGATSVGGKVVVLVRVAERPRERRPGFTALPRWAPGQGLVVDWAADDDLVALDPRVVRGKSDGLVRLTFISHLQVVRCGDGGVVDSAGAASFGPESELEEYGVEDPRITLIGERFYFTYVAVSRHGAATALASTTDFQTFTRHGVIFCPENKDVVLFPQQIAKDYLALHRPNGATPFTRPEMWLARSPDLYNWGNHAFLLGGKAGWDSGRVGAGPPPLRTPDGWLLIYHGNRLPRHAGDVGAYSAGAMLLDLADPARVLRQTADPILEPTSEFEQSGFVSNVVFPTGIVERGDSLLVYYGAADTFTAVVELSLADILAALKEEKEKATP
jgi:predicted GH43/DUF377 family glycosyl hydrolase